MDRYRWPCPVGIFHGTRRISEAEVPMRSGSRHQRRRRSGRLTDFRLGGGLPRSIAESDGGGMLDAAGIPFSDWHLVYERFLFFLLFPPR